MQIFTSYKMLFSCTNSKKVVQQEMRLMAITMYGPPRVTSDYPDESSKLSEALLQADVMYM